METQRMLDALTDHLAIYHRSSYTNTECKARQTVIEWMASLTCDQRRAALTIVDKSWVAVLLRMQKYLIEEGAGSFFLLPDVPVVCRENASVGPKSSRSTRGKIDEKNSAGKSSRSSKVVGLKGTEGSSSPSGGKRAGKDSTVIPLPPPELCYRRAKGLVRRLESKQTSGSLLVNSIRLFNSSDGENNNWLPSGGTGCIVDCITVTEEFVINLDAFVEVMDNLSHFEFLKNPCLSPASPWEEMPWLKQMGYYSLPAFIANKFEFGLWSAWSHSHGVKKLPKSIALKLKDNQNGSAARVCSCDSNAIVASSVFGRKLGCTVWWSKLGSNERSKLVKCALAEVAKTEVLKIVGASRAACEANDPKKKNYQKAVLIDFGKTKSRCSGRMSLSDSEVDVHANYGFGNERKAAFGPYCTGLQALKELSESGLLSAELEGLGSYLETNAGWLFGSTLKSVHNWSDQVIRDARNVLVKVRNDHVERELFGDDNSSNAQKGNGGTSRDSKVSKAKKRRRKQGSTSKSIVPKDEEKTGSPNPKHAEEEQNEEDSKEIGREIESGSVNTNIHSCIPVVAPISNESQAIAKCIRTLPWEGVGEISAAPSDISNLCSTRVFEETPLESEIVAQHAINDLSCSLGSLEESKNRFDNVDAISEDKFPTIQLGSQVCAERTISSIDHPGNQTNLSSSILNSSDRNLCEYQDSLVNTSNTRITVNSSDDNEVPSDNSVLRLSKDESHDNELPPSLNTERPFFQEHYTSVSESNVRSVSFIGDLGVPSDNSSSDKRVSNYPANALPSTGKPNGEFDTHLVQEPSTICFGTVDAVLPESQKAAIFLGFGKHLVNGMTAKLPKNGPSSQDRLCSNDTSKPVLPALNGISRFTIASRLTNYSGSRQAHYQQGPAFRPGPHEWPGSPQFGYFGAYHQPKATDWLQLDVGRDWPQQMESNLLSYRSAPVPRNKNGQVDSLSQRTIATRTSNVNNVDMANVVHPGYTMTSGLGYSINIKEESRLNGRLKNPTSLSSGHGKIEIDGSGPNLDKSEVEEQMSYDTDVDDYGHYNSVELNDSDGHIISEEEGETYLEDAVENCSADYNQIFGGGVMYWNAADYAGLGYSRPGSHSSEDSSWARQEADLSAVMDDIVHFQPIQGPYAGKGSTPSNAPSCSPSPPSSSSVPLNFEQHIGPVPSPNPRHGLPRPAVDFSGKFVQISSQGISAEEQAVSNTRVPITLEVIEQIRADISAQPILRPIVVVRDLSLSRQFSAGEILRLQEAKSPHIVPRSRRDIPGHRKRPPSPVLRCVPPAPPPPPPSPVAGLRRRKGFMAARSGSSSPRHWGLVNFFKDDSEGSDGRQSGENSDGFHSAGSRSITNNPPMHPLSGALLRERLVAIPSLSLEQEHPDVSIPMKTTLLHNSNPALHLGLTKLLSALHVEIDTFTQQVAVENRMRKPFINMAVKKVAHSLQVLWPRSRINIFGSIATGLALPTSDVDLVICLPPVRNLEPIKEAGILEGRNGIKETSLQHAARYLGDQDWVKIDSMKTIENTPVPIIMMVAEFLPHQYDIGDDITPFFFGSNIRKEINEEAPKLDQGIPAGLTVSESYNKGSTMLGDNSKGPWGGKEARHLVHLDISFETPSHTGLRTAELVRELISQFPALSPLALVLKQFLTDRSLDHPYTGGLSSYCLVLLITRFLQHQNHHGKPSSNLNLGRLFMDFLHFFGYVFDPRRMGIRIRGGGMYVRRGYQNIDPIYIEDPLHPDNNVGRNCFRILQCVKAFADGYSILEKKLHEMSAVSEDSVAEVESLELLMMMLPCMMRK